MGFSKHNRLGSLLLWLLLIGSGVVRAQASPLSDLDALRYIASHPDLIEAYGVSAEQGRSHYTKWGVNEGRKITFEPLYYTASHPDLIEAFGLDETKSVTHYIRWGYKERRQTTFTELTSLRYIASHPDLIEALGADAGKGVRHYIQWGYKEGRPITFDPLRYTASHFDLIDAFGVDERKATTHYIQWGYKEKRQVTFRPIDALNYIASSFDLIAAFGADVAAGTRHYVQWGFKEGRKIVFDALAYIASHFDLISAFGADAVAGATHYINFGYVEGRKATFNVLEYLGIPKNSDVLAAYGSDLDAAKAHYINFGYREGRTAYLSKAEGTLTGGPLDFGKQQGATNSSAKTLFLTNTGAPPITNTSITLVGADRGDFTYSTTCGVLLGPGVKCAILVRFSPLATSTVGNKSASLSLSFSGIKTPLTVELRGEVPASDIEIAAGAGVSSSVNQSTGIATITWRDVFAATYYIESESPNKTFSELVRVRGTGSGNTLSYQFRVAEPLSIRVAARDRSPGGDIELKPGRVPVAVVVVPPSVVVSYDKTRISPFGVVTQFSLDLPPSAKAWPLVEWRMIGKHGVQRYSVTNIGTTTNLNSPGAVGFGSNYPVSVFGNVLPFQGTGDFPSGTYDVIARIFTDSTPSFVEVAGKFDVTNSTGNCPSCIKFSAGFSNNGNYCGQRDSLYVTATATHVSGIERIEALRDDRSLGIRFTTEDCPTSSGVHERYAWLAGDSLPTTPARITFKILTRDSTSLSLTYILHAGGICQADTSGCASAQFFK